MMMVVGGHVGDRWLLNNLVPLQNGEAALAACGSTCVPLSSSGCHVRFLMPVAGAGSVGEVVIAVTVGSCACSVLT